MTPVNKIHLPFLDGLRGLAILSVFLFHGLHATFGYDRLEWSGVYRNFEAPRSFLMLYPFTYGSAGVAIFFVVSGFCIHLSHQRSRERGWLPFANRRFFRIYPPYLLALLIFFFLWPWGSLSLNSSWRLNQLTTHLLAIHNFDENMFYGINPSFWSIAIEAQLYLLYPLLLLLATKLGWKRTLLIVGSGEIWIRLFVSLHSLTASQPLPWFIESSPFAFWLSWSLGAYLCECSLKGRRSRLFAVPFWLAAAVAMAVPFLKFTAPFTFLAFSFATAIAIERLLSQAWTFPPHPHLKPIWSHLSLLGVVSYSFYLIHQPIIELTGRISAKLLPGVVLHPLLKYGLCLAWYPLIFLSSYLLYRWIEQPSIQLGKIVLATLKESRLAVRRLAARQR